MKLLNLIINEVAITKGNWQPIPSSDLKDLEDEIANAEGNESKYL